MGFPLTGPVVFCGAAVFFGAVVFPGAVESPGVGVVGDVAGLVPGFWLSAAGLGFAGAVRVP